MLDFFPGFPPWRFPARQVRVQSVLTVLAARIAARGYLQLGFALILGGFVANGEWLLGALQVILP